jgi:lipid II:glycine glycyltransferase (peptidoglycan interpeptide bridge formation enzyme)
MGQGLQPLDVPPLSMVDTKMMPDWNDLIQNLPGAHALQTQQWAELKSQYNWQPSTRIWKGENNEPSAAALTLIRSIPMRGLTARVSIAYSPKGPLLDWSNSEMRQLVLSDMIRDAKKKGAIFLKIDPEVRLGTGVPGREDEHTHQLGHEIIADLKAKGWVFAQDQIQYRNTVMVDLTLDEDELMAAMKQKTRYNVRLAARRGVEIRPAGESDFEELYQMYAETSARDGFVIRDKGYYLSLWKKFWDEGLLDPLIAEVEGEAVGAVVIFRFAKTAIYMHGMSTNAHRKRMPNYLLQWEAMRRAKAAGCSEYDLWGAPDHFNKEDGMWGVFRFKEGFNGSVVRHIGAWDYPIRPLYYNLYSKVLPKLLGAMRQRGMARTRSTLD